jgi:hypothetical protein
MHCASELAGYSAIHAYGTAEGVQKAWDSRGRGRKTVPAVTKGFAKGKAATAAPKPGTKLTKKVANWAKASYDTMKTDEKTLGKIESSKTRTGIVLKHLWFAKRLGDLAQSWDGFKMFTDAIVKATKGLAKAAVGLGGAHEAVQALHVAVIHLAPVMHHILILAGGGNFGLFSEAEQ